MLNYNTILIVLKYTLLYYTALLFYYIIYSTTYSSWFTLYAIVFYAIVHYHIYPYYVILHCKIFTTLDYVTENTVLYHVTLHLLTPSCLLLYGLTVREYLLI